MIKKLLLPLFVTAQDAGTLCSLPSTGSVDVGCLIQNAQFTVTGTVTDTNIGLPGSTASESNYNATLQIQCVFSSFSSPISTGVGLAGQKITVVGWGKPKAGCPNNQYSGTSATLNQNQIYFLYVAKPGSSPTTNIYGINYICVGGVQISSENMQILSNVLSANPSNSVSSELKGDPNICGLPNASNNGQGTQTPVTVPGNGVAARSFATSLLSAAFGVFAYIF